MSAVPTVLIVAKGGGVQRINESDFDPAIHKLHKESKAAVTAEDESDDKGEASTPKRRRK